MSDTLRWGILATGNIAHSFARDLIADGHTISAVASRSQGSADAFAAEFGVPRAYGSYAALAADPEVDIAYIATPHPFHAENAELLLASGKHVLIEKSVTLNAREAERVARAAAEHGRVAMEAMWTRFLPHVARIREIIAAGTLGELRSFTADHRQSLSRDPNHRINAPALGGGALLDLGVYPISFASRLFGTPAEIQATAVMNQYGVDAQVATLFRYAGGQIAATLSALDSEGPTVASIVGTDARIDIDRVWYAPTSFTVTATGGGVLERWESRVPGRGMQFQAREIERLVAEGSGESDVMPFSESIAIMRTMDEVRRQIGLVYPGEADVMPFSESIAIMRTMDEVRRQIGLVYPGEADAG